jgi:ligand-binding SRPBCC domain-containing protein
MHRVLHLQASFGQPFSSRIVFITMSKTHRLKNIQLLPVSLAEAWAFFSNPHNLAVITPPFLNLKVTNELKTNEIFPGQVITYKVKPLLGIPVHWATEISHVEPQKMFVDEQRKGPYRLWHHEHHFKAIESGVEMTDLVHYQLPFGILGEIGHPLVVKSKLEQIFTYRYFKTIEMLGDWPGSKINLRID